MFNYHSIIFLLSYNYTSNIIFFILSIINSHRYQLLFLFSTEKETYKPLLCTDIYYQLFFFDRKRELGRDGFGKKIFTADLPVIEEYGKRGENMSSAFFVTNKT